MSNPYTELKQTIEQLYGSTATAINKEAITLGARNSITGWPAITYTESNINGVILPRGRGFAAHPPGFHGVNDFEGFSATACVVGDQWKDAGGNYYLIANAVPYKGGSATVQFYAYDLKLLSEWQAVSGSTTWSKTRLEDPRHKMKHMCDDHARAAQITKDDDSTQALWAAIFDNPPYPLHLEFRHPSAAVQGLYVCGRNRSTALIDNNLSAYGYRDDTIVDVCTVDSTGCAGWALAWKMEHELRYVMETYPTGSLWLFNTTEQKPVDIGGMWLYDLQCRIIYERSKTA